MSFATAVAAMLAGRARRGDLVTPQERHRQLSWNRTTDEGVPQCVHEVVSAQVERTPDAIAVQVGETTLTYRQLDDRAAAIASRLTQAGAGRGTVVALLLERTSDVVAAILGVLRSGAAFLPLDQRQPDARNTFCINDVGATIVVTDRKLPAGGDAIAAAVIDLGDVGSHVPSRHASPSGVSTDDLAYVICTSGSTGRPKPVLIEHRGVTNLMRNLVREFGISAGDTVLSVVSISFDMALFDIFSALTCGARVVLASAAEAVNPASMNRLIAEQGATYMFATPTIWGSLIAAGWSGDQRLRAAAGGETLSDGLAEALLQRCGAVWNGYGPTEATAGTSMARLATDEPVTVGRPLPNVRVYITDPQGRLQPVGVPGEITIGGVGVGRGYLNRPGEQARRFGDDPFHAGGRIYRTGDRGKFLPDGRIQHLGRYDDQLKIRGFRVEPGEIESTLCEHPDVGSCAVVARTAPNGERQLVAYIVGESKRLSDAEARGWLRRRLPEHMVPGAFVHLSALPRTTNGKLDKAALPAPARRDPGRSGGQPPRNDTEARLAALWAELLGVPVTDVSSDFFDLGGHSLLAARLISEVEQRFGVKLSLESFIESGRIVATLAELLDAERPTEADEVTSGPPLHFIFSDHASAMSTRHFTTQWGDTQRVHALIPEQPGGQFDRSASVEDLARHTLSTICARQPDGPLALAGYSIGGLVAYEVARQALEAGRAIDWLGILDAVAPPMHELKRAQLTLRWRLHALRQRPAGERWATYAEGALRVLRGQSPSRRRDFDYRGAAEIACRYQQPPHQVPMHVFVSEDSAASAGDDLLGWSGFHKGPLTGHRFAGDHVSLLRPPAAEQVGKMMLESISRSKELRRAQCGGAAGLSAALTTFADPAPPRESEREFELVKHWARNRLGKSHPDLGRVGAVCPFIDAAMKKDLLRVVFVRGNNFSHDSLVRLIAEIAEAFPELSPVHGPDSTYKAVLVVFPELTDFALIDSVQDACKSAFVERGLMVGQFYPGHQRGGLHNPDFKPLDAPMAMLAVRNMVVSDYPFLRENEKWMGAYLSRFARAIPVNASGDGCPQARRPHAV
jgi:amino acid adenylation domain-containing protein